MKYKKKKKQKVSFLDEVVSKLKKNDISFDDFLSLLEQNDEKFFENPELEFELLISNGFPIDVIDNNIVLTTKNTSLNDQTFCIVDIETNGNSVKNGQIIEIGAVKYKNGEIVDKYDSLVYAKNIPKYIQEVTNITPDMLEDAPVIQTVLEEFKIFLQDDVFVAHNIKFDYSFVSDSFKQYDLGKLQNRSLCTIDLAKRTIDAKRYGLDFISFFSNFKHHTNYCKISFFICMY
jgi:DNA polymerase-3 subunit epsilon